MPMTLASLLPNCLAATRLSQRCSIWRWASLNIFRPGFLCKEDAASYIPAPAMARPAVTPWIGEGLPVFGESFLGKAPETFLQSGLFDFFLYLSDYRPTVMALIVKEEAGFVNGSMKDKVKLRFVAWLLTWCVKQLGRSCASLHKKLLRGYPLCRPFMKCRLSEAGPRRLSRKFLEGISKRHEEARQHGDHGQTFGGHICIGLYATNSDQG